MLLGDSVINVEIISLKHYYCLTESMCVSRADVSSIAALTCLSSDLEVVNHVKDLANLMLNSRWVLYNYNKLAQ